MDLDEFEHAPAVAGLVIEERAFFEVYAKAAACTVAKLALRLVFLSRFSEDLPSDWSHSLDEFGRGGGRAHAGSALMRAPPGAQPEAPRRPRWTIVPASIDP